MARRIDTEAEIDWVRLADQAGDPASPAAGYKYFYAKSGGLYAINSAGAVVGPFSGDVATDTIWDAKGDLAVGTGANTAARLATAADSKSLATYASTATGLVWGKVYVEDNFNRADAATVGDPQIGDRPAMYKNGGIGDWGITSNRLVPKSSQAENMIFWDCGVTRYKVSCTIVTKSTDGGVIIRSNNHAPFATMMVFLNDGSSRYTIYKAAPGWSKVATGPTVVPSNGDTLIIYVSATRIQLFVNGAGTAEIDYSTTAEPVGTCVGFRENGGTALVVDDLKAEEW